MNDKKIIFFDLDSTLIYHGEEESFIPESAKKAVKVMQENGHIVAVATGRGPILTKGICNELGINTYVCFNGHYAVCEGEVIINTPLDKDDISKAINEIKEQDLHTFAMGMDRIYSNRMEEAKKIAERTSEEIELKEWEYTEEDYYDIVVSDSKTLINSEFKNIEIKILGDKQFYFSIKGVSKASGIMMISEKLGIKTDNIYAFGDGYNDLEMIEDVGIGVAMGNAIEELKDIANHVTTHVNEEGVHNACKYLELI